MTYLRLIVIFLMTAAVLPTHAAETCSRGYGTLNAGEPCIPQSLLNYLYCLGKSGGGKIEVVQSSENSANHSSEIAINGRGSGVVISGGVGGILKKADVVRVAKGIREKLDPSLVSNCKSLATKLEKAGPAANGGKNADAPKGPKQELRPVSDATSRAPQPELESVDFAFDQTEVTDRSLVYLRDVAKRFARLQDSRIALVPEFRSQQQYDHEAAQSENEHSLSLRRQLAIRNVLVLSGFQSDRIVFEQHSARIIGTELRFDNAGKRIESGMMVQAWP